MLNSLRQTRKKFNALRQIRKRLNSLRLNYKRFNSLSHIGNKKSPILWVRKKDFNSLSHLEEIFIEIQFDESSRISWKKKKVQFTERVILKKFNTLSHIRENSWVLWVVLENFNSLSRIKKIQCRKKKSCSKKQVQLCEVVLKKIQFCESYSYFKKKKKHFESHNEKGDQFFESFFFLKKILKQKRFKSVSHKKSRILWVMLKKFQFFESFFFWKKGSVLWVIQEKMFNSLSHFFLEKSSNFWVFFFKKIHLKTWVRFFESYSRKRVPFFKSYSKKRKVPILLVTLKKFNSLSYIQRRFYSLSHFKKNSTLIEKRFINEAQFNESFTKSSILWVIVEKTKKVQFFESIFQTGSIISVSQNFCKKKNLWVTFKKMGSISMNHVEKRVQSILWVMSHQKKKFNSVSCIRKRCSILWVVLEKKFNSVSRITKSINALSHFFCKEGSIQWVIFFEKFRILSIILKKRFNSVGHIQEKGLIHWDILKKKFNSSSQVEKERKQFFTSESKKSSTLWDFSFDTRFNFFDSFF